MAANPLSVIEFGRHPTCLFGPFGAAAAAAHLLGMDGSGLAKAWGIVLSMASGANQFAFEPKGTMVKRMHGGIPAQNGITAAQLAHLGVEGPIQAIEGELGFLHLFGIDTRPELLRKESDAAFEVHNISIKPYSCCRKFHSLIDALDSATDGFSLDATSIDRITVHSPETAVVSHQMKRPDSVMAAQYSMPYITAATLAYGPKKYGAYEAEYHRDPTIISLIDKIEAHHDPKLDGYLPDRMANRIVVTFEGGREAS
ncbi:MAG: MmgE/PrpD family protein, partial [Rickettsiales bacterium]